MSTKLEELYNSENSLKEKLKEVQTEILKEKALESFNRFEEDKYYEINTPMCISYYFHCTFKPTPNKDGTVYIHNVLEILSTRMFYNVTLVQTWGFNVDDVNSWEIIEISKEDFEDEYKYIKDRVDEVLSEEPAPNSIEECLKEIKIHENQIKVLRDKAEKLWTKPDCSKCTQKNSPCVPNIWDCTGFIEDK